MEKCSDKLFLTAYSSYFIKKPQGNDTKEQLIDVELS